MTGHVFVRLIGYGAIVTPYTPFRIMRHGGREAQLHVQSAGREQILDFANQLPATIPMLLDVEHGPNTNNWQLETSLYTAPWPPGFDLVSTRDAASPAGFDLVGAEGAAMIFVQGPFSVQPDVRTFPTSDQRQKGVGQVGDYTWIRVAYSHEQQDWEQAHIVCRLGAARWLVVSTQAPARQADATFSAATELAVRLKPRA